jgi:hypothetical protein
VSATSLVPRSYFDQPGAAGSDLAFDPSDQTLYVKGNGGVHRWDVRVMKPIAPVFSFAGRLEGFGLTSRPEGVIGMTGNGQIVLRPVSDAGTISGPWSFHAPRELNAR